MRMALWIAGVGAFACISTTSLMAQTPADVPVCMSKVMQDRAGNKLTIVVSPDSQAAMMSRGFIVEPCAGKERDLDDYRRRICALANRNEPGLQNALMRLAGVSPNELCVKANQITKK